MKTNISDNYLKVQNSVYQRIGLPVSVEVVYATLESMGVKCDRVHEDFGYESLDILSQHIYSGLTTKTHLAKQENKELINNTLFKTEVKTGFFNFIKEYAYNSSYLIAFLIQIISIITSGFSIYVYIHFNQLQSTIVLLGIIIGMTISGGFIEVIGNQISRHFLLKDYILVEKLTFFIVKKSIIIFIALLFFIIGLNIIFPFFTIKIILIICSYAFLVGILFLAFAPLHIIRKKIMIAIAILIATLVCLPFVKYTEINIYLLHFIGLLVSLAITLLYTKYYFKKMRPLSKSSNIKFNKGVIFYNNINYFIYGVLLKSFFFIDRIIAWSGHEHSNLFMPIFYEKDYEIGMDIAIIFYLLLAGVLDYCNKTFHKLIREEKSITSIFKLDDYKKKMVILYVKNILILLTFAIPVYVLILYIFYGKWGYNYFFTEPLNQLNIKVANIAIVGYIFLCIALLNTSFCISMKRQKNTLKILITCCIINISLAFIISRLTSYENSVYGMSIASALFLLLSFIEIRKIYKNIDFYATL